MSADRFHATIRVGRLNRDRQERAWSAVDLANASGLSQSYVSKILTGQRGSLKAVKAMAEALGHPLRRYLVFPKDEA